MVIYGYGVVSYMKKKPILFISVCFVILISVLFSTLFSHAQKEREEEKIRKEIYEATENYFLSKQDQFMVGYESTISIPRLQREGYLSKNIASSFTENDIVRIYMNADHTFNLELELKK